jgi:hypothetical protein
MTAMGASSRRVLQVLDVEVTDKIPTSLATLWAAVTDEQPQQTIEHQPGPPFR